MALTREQNPPKRVAQRIFVMVDYINLGNWHSLPLRLTTVPQKVWEVMLQSEKWFNFGMGR